MAKGVILPKKGIFELKKMCEEETTELSLGFMDNSAVIRKGNTVVVMRLVDGEFPDYTRVVPVANNRIVTVDRDTLLHSLRRMSILSSEKFKGIKMEIQPELMVISSSNPELGEASEELEAAYSGDPLSVRFNAKYLLDVLAILGEAEVALILRDELSPAIMRPAGDEGFTAVIMPMRL
jgi:DNA polymerase-3 subunit beta